MLLRLIREFKSKEIMEGENYPFKPSSLRSNLYIWDSKQLRLRSKLLRLRLNQKLYLLILLYFSPTIKIGWQPGLF